MSSVWQEYPDMGPVEDSDYMKYLQSLYTPNPIPKPPPTPEEIAYINKINKEQDEKNVNASMIVAIIAGIVSLIVSMFAIGFLLSRNKIITGIIISFIAIGLWILTGFFIAGALGKGPLQL